MNDITALLEHIEKATTLGVNLRDPESIDDDYYDLKEARLVARETERMNALGIDQKEEPDWQCIWDLCYEILLEKSLDIEVVAFAIESLVRLEGIAGFTRGYEIALTLVQTHWVTLCDRHEDDSTLLLPLISLNGEDQDGTLIQPLKQLTSTSLTVTQCEAAISTYQAFCDWAASNLTGCELPDSRIKETISLLLMSCLEQRETSINSEANTKKTQSEVHSQPTSSYTRVSALSSLCAIANYFETHEPHSPLPYLIRRAVNWANLPLANLLDELIVDRGIRERTFELIGIASDEH